MLFVCRSFCGDLFLLCLFLLRLVLYVFPFVRHLSHAMFLLLRVSSCVPIMLLMVNGQRSTVNPTPPPQVSVTVDHLLPHVLHIPPSVALYNHPLVTSGHLVLQGWSSCLPAAALAPEQGWTVLDACAAPGNKTSHLAGRC